MDKGKRKLLYAMGSVLAVFGILIVSSHYSPALASSLSEIRLSALFSGIQM